MDVEGDRGAEAREKVGAGEEGAGSGRNSAKWRDPTKIGWKAGGLIPPAPPPPPRRPTPNMDFQRKKPLFAIAHFEVKIQMF